MPKKYAGHQQRHPAPTLGPSLPHALPKLGRRRSLVAVIFSGFIVNICLITIGFFLGALCGVFLTYFLMQLWPTLDRGDWLNILVPTLGTVYACIAPAVSRHLYYHLKVNLLKRNGITVQATLTNWKRTVVPNPKGSPGDRVDLTITWQHPKTERWYTCECCYLFLFGLTKKETDLLLRYRPGSSISLIFAPQHPWYFALEIPFIPCWFDIVF